MTENEENPDAFFIVLFLDYSSVFRTSKSPIRTARLLYKKNDSEQKIDTEKIKNLKKI